MNERRTDDLRRSFAALQDHPRGEGCAQPSEIWAAARGEAPRGRAKALLEHSRECSECAEAWRLAGALVESAPASRFSYWPIAGLAAAVLLVGLVVLPRMLQGPVAPPIERDDGRLQIESLIPEDRPLQRNQAVLRWTAGPDGSLYDVELVEEDLDEVFRVRDARANEVRIPPEALSHIPSGAKLLWRVEVVLADGERISSPTFIHELE